MEILYDIIGTMAAYRAGTIFLILGIVLVLIDYIFNTDVPAHFGYSCFAASMFFAVSSTPLISALIALGAWAGFEILHVFFLRRFLANAEDADYGAESDSQGATASEKTAT